MNLLTGLKQLLSFTLIIGLISSSLLFTSCEKDNESTDDTKTTTDSGTTTDEDSKDKDDDTNNNSNDVTKAEKNAVTFDGVNYAFKGALVTKQGNVDNIVEEDFIHSIFTMKVY